MYTPNPQPTGIPTTEATREAFTRNHKTALLAVAILTVIAAAAFAYSVWSPRDEGAQRAEMFAHFPADPTTVVFLDFEHFRSSAFLQELLAKAPAVTVEKEYADFVQATGFRYEEDLQRVGVAWQREQGKRTTVAIVDGNFDRKKIEAYAAQTGKRLGESEPTFEMPAKNGNHPYYLKFLSAKRLAFTDNPSYSSIFAAMSKGHGPDEEWTEHFTRLSGTPIFAVMRQDPALANLMTQLQSGLRSPQLAGLIAQLQWITLSAKPDGSSLRVVAEGESAGEATVTQLRDFLQGIVALAEAGLDGPANRNSLKPEVRDAYLNMLKGAQVDKTDRGNLKSVRLILEIPSEFLQVSESSKPALK